MSGNRHDNLHDAFLRPKLHRRHLAKRSTAIVQHRHLGGNVTMAKAPATATGYCMKCKTQREIKNAKPITMKNGRAATEGTCPVCSTKMFKIGGTK
jgi:hypothetical protein